MRCPACKSDVARSGAPKLLAIKLYYQLLVNRAVNVFASRQSGNHSAHFRSRRRDPGWAPAAGSSLPRAFDVRVLTTRFLHGDYILGFYLIRRNINFAFVDQHMSVIDKLSRLATGSRKARPIDGIVQTPLEQEQKVFTRDSLLARSLFEVISELSLENKVNSFDLLLFAKLLAITGERLPTTH